MLEMYISGVSTRKVSKIVEALCGQSVSKSFVSSLTEQLDQWSKSDRTARFRMPIKDECLPFVSLLPTPVGKDAKCTFYVASLVQFQKRIQNRLKKR